MPAIAARSSSPLARGDDKSNGYVRHVTHRVMTQRDAYAVIDQRRKGEERGTNLEDVLNCLLASEQQIAGYALIQPTGQVLVAYGCLFEGLLSAPGAVNPAGDVIDALLFDATRTVVTLEGKKMHVVRREPDMLVAIEALQESEGGRHPVACSAHSIVGNNVCLVAYERGEHRLAVPRVLCALHDLA